MKLNKLIITAVMAVLLTGIVWAGFTFPGIPHKPTDGTVLTSTSVNFSFMINNTESNGANYWTVAIINTSDRLNDSSFTTLFRINATNATMINRTIAMADGKRNYWKLNITNSSSVSVPSPRYIFNVDAQYFKLSFGTQKMINFTLDSGNASFAGRVNFGNNFTLYDTGGTLRTCGVNVSTGMHCV